jgi:acetyl-CoA C-acetyltransferase
MHLAKHVAAVWSSMPLGEPEVADPAALQATVEADQPRHHVVAAWSGAATVLAYTVAHGRDGSAEQGLVVLDTPDGRALARVKDPALLADAESRELVGQSVVVTTDGTSNEASW